MYAFDSNICVVEQSRNNAIMKIEEILGQLAQRAGIEPGTLQIENGEIADEYGAKLLTLMNEQAALSNEGIRNAVLGKTLGAIDEKILGVASHHAAHLPDGYVTELRKHKKTSELVEDLVGTLSTNYKQKLEAMGNKDEAVKRLSEDLKQSGELQAKFRKEKEEAEKERDALKMAWHNERVDNVLLGHIDKKVLTGPDSATQRLQKQAILQGIRAKADFVFTDEGTLVANKKGTDLPYLDAQTQQPDFTSLITEVGTPFFAKRQPVDPELKKPAPGTNLTKEQLSKMPDKVRRRMEANMKNQISE